MNEIEYLYCNQTYFGVNCEFLSIERWSDGRYFIEYSDYKYDENSFVFIPDADDGVQLQNMLLELRLTEWKRKYLPTSPILDGESWEVHYSVIDGEICKIAGENAYPPTWDKLRKITAWLKDLFYSEKYRKDSCPVGELQIL